ncbi:MAG: hypothetical protein HUK26_04340, partial [Duodenibacillus sp.]|nr:hypothetical protein [Duodenibacillus sp.]
MKRRIVVLLLLAAAAAGGWHWHQGRIEEEARARGPGLRLYGAIDLRTVKLAFEESGRIVALSAQEGDAVEAGQGDFADIEDALRRLGV